MVKVNRKLDLAAKLTHNSFRWKGNSNEFAAGKLKLFLIANVKQEIVSTPYRM